MHFLEHYSLMLQNFLAMTRYMWLYSVWRTQNYGHTMKMYLCSTSCVLGLRSNSDVLLDETKFKENEKVNRIIVTWDM